MRAELKRLHSPDVHDLNSFVTEDYSNFSFLLQAFIGPSDSYAEESFDIIICTPAWLMQECKKSGVVSGRHKLIVEDYDIQAITKYIEDYCARVSGNTWGDIAVKLHSLGAWEFDNYVRLGE